METISARTRVPSSCSQNLREGPSQDHGNPKIKVMLEKVLQDQEKLYAFLKSLIEVVSSTVSIQKLEQQMRDLSKEHNLKQKVQLPSYTIVNLKGNEGGPNAHHMAIITHDDKIFKLGIYKNDNVKVDDGTFGDDVVVEQQVGLEN
ncbi:hypothetical protein HAX54_011663 [Datura stramonium]|uniref:Uncharacterized protein n=1 Tax=Datura stramonium TaxID=4076 RepID=A0ABS8TK65_DATST|nr:hypothetical protein [Datura stramonium]